MAEAYAPPAPLSCTIAGDGRFLAGDALHYKDPVDGMPSRRISSRARWFAGCSPTRSIKIGS